MHQPKSPILQIPLTIIIFSGLISRWQMFFSWRYWIPCPISHKHLKHYPSRNAPYLSSFLNKVSSPYSNSIYIFFLSLIVWYKDKIFVWFREFCIEISRFICSSKLFISTVNFNTSFIANKKYVDFARQRYTLANRPTPK